MRRISIGARFLGNLKRIVAVALFTLCVASTFISYQPYLFRWDDSDYLQRSIAVSRGFWSGDLHAVVAGIAGSIRPPVMTLLGVPWGRLDSWDAAGKCFVTLAALTSVFAALCLCLLLRIGVKPVFLVIASVCMVASIGPDPAAAVASSANSPFSTHVAAVAFLADGLFSWITLAAILLIPYEARTCSQSIKDAVGRGILWGTILSLGAITKVSFFYFIVLILPALFVLRVRHGGFRSAVTALIAMAVCSTPAAIYWLRWGRPAWDNARNTAFANIPGLNYGPLSQFLLSTIRESPGLVPSTVLAAAAIIYLLFKKRTVLRGVDFLALLSIIGFGVVALASSNREIRFVLPAIVALPFLIAVLMSGEGYSVCGRSALFAAGLVFCGLVAVSLPMRHRPNRQSLGRCDAVLAQAAKCNAKRILLATDNATLNADLMKLALAVSASAGSVEVRTLAYSSAPIEEDFYEILQADQVVFQEIDASSSPIANHRASEYEGFIRRQGGYVSIGIGDDVRVYPIRCNSR